MKSFEQTLNRFVKINQRLEKILLIAAVRRGLTSMIPLLLIGSFALLFLSLPIPGYQDFMARVFGVPWSSVFEALRNGTFNTLALFMVLFVSYAYHTEYSERKRENRINPIIGAGVALSSFIIISAISNDGFSILNFGTTNVFAAIFVALCSSVIFARLCSVTMLRFKSFSDGSNTAFNQAILSLIPAAITVAVFAGLHHLLKVTLNVQDIKELLSLFFVSISQSMHSPLLNTLLFVFLIHLLWFFGMHGSNMLEHVTQTIFVGAMAVNTGLLSSGLAPTEIFTKTFIDSFVLMGGCGSTLALVLAIFISGKHRNQKRLMKLSAAPVLANINETVTFGLPIVLNPVYLIPFVFTPMLLTVVSYLAMSTGLVPLTSQTVEWTTPVLLSGYVSTGSIAGSILQLFNLALAVLCYIPFVKLSEKIAAMQMKNNIDKLNVLVDDFEHVSKTTSFLTRQDDIGNLSRFLANELEMDFKEGKLTLFYQPQVDADGVIFGAEALLRWKHDILGYIKPTLTIALAEESNMIHRIGDWIFEKACNDLKSFNIQGYPDIVMSVNLSAIQLENPSFAKKLGDTISRTGIKPEDLKIEITEKLAFTGNKMMVDQLKGVRQMGIKLAMDDFGMGHSSLMYLKEYEFDAVKLDGSLVREMQSNSCCADIISSIIYLSQTMGFSVIAEYVETKAQQKALKKLGCMQYQGYLYSPALPFDEFMNYLNDPKIPTVKRESKQRRRAIKPSDTVAVHMKS